jgi:ABC-type dipeptide/oligopeptide/nickel transport system permease subunit
MQAGGDKTMAEEDSDTGDFGAKFMLQEHSRIIDAYHDLHVQKNELLKFYLAFVSIPLSVVALFLTLSRFVPPENSVTIARPGSTSSQPAPNGAAGTSATPGPATSQPAPTGTAGTNVASPSVSSQPAPTGTPGSGQSQNVNQLPSLVGSLRDAATYLSILLIPVGFAVIKTMLDIRTEQYLYAQTVNAARNFFKTKYKIEEKYFVLPFDPKEIEFGGNEAFGRTFWEAMIVSTPTTLLFGFLVFRLLHVLGMVGNCARLLSVFISLITFIGLSSFVSSQLRKRLQGLKDRISKIHGGEAPLPSSTDLSGEKGDRRPTG